MVPIVVMFPDHQGKDALDGEFVTRIKNTLPKAVIVPILNGLPLAELATIAGKVSGSCEPVVAADARGLLDTLIAGYVRVLGQYPLATVVRLDTAEHPVTDIPRLIEVAININGMAIGDLEFEPGTLRSDSIDEFAHLDLFPELYRQTTRGKLSISCAHGYQAFAPGVLRAVLTAAQCIVHRVQQELGPISWGFDGAMALGAVGIGTPVTVEKVEAQVLRDRPRAKVASQFAGALRMCLAAGQLFQY